MKKLLALVLLVLPAVAFAASGAHGDHDAIPVKAIIVQCVNVALVIGLLIYLLRKPAAQHFAERSETFNALLNKAEQAKKEAEENRRVISQKLSALEQNAQTSLVQAKDEAEQLRAKIVADAKALSTKLSEEAKKTVDFEILRAKEEIRKDLLQAAVQDAESSMEKGVKDQDQKRLQTEFVQRVQVVR